MSLISDIVLKQVQASAGSVSVPSNLQNQVFGGLSESILGGLTQTAQTPGGLDMLKQLFTGKSMAAAAPVSNIASQLFTGNVLKKLNLGSSTNSLLSGLIPSIVGKLSGVVKDQDGDGDVDLQDILIALTKGGSGAGRASSGASILGAATSVLGSILKKK